MIQFNEDAFLMKQESIVDTRSDIERIAREVLTSGLRNVYVIGAGGTYANALPYEEFATSRSDLPVRVRIATELIATGSREVGAGTLAVFSTVSGTTPDILAAVEWVKAQGATVLVFTGKGDSPIALAADHVVLSAPEAWPFDVQYIYLLGSILHERGEFPDYPELAADLVHLPKALLSVAQNFDAAAQAFGQSHADLDYAFLVGAGNAWGFTYCYSMCVLEEMQWIRTTRVHGSEFFHGSLELLEKDTTVLLMVGEDAARPVMERVAAFVPRISEDVTVLDTRDFALDGIRPQYRGIVSPIVLEIASDRISKHLSVARDHSLNLRRYYRVMDY